MIADASGSATTDASLTSTPAATCLTDDDGDGFGIEPSTAACPLQGNRPKGVDCNDTTSKAYPGASEVCGDGLDNDCNGKIDDGKAERCNGIDDDCDPGTPDGAGACGSFACRDAKCLTSCSADVDCASGLQCLAGKCTGSNDGMACASDEQCTTGACHPDGVCRAKLPSGSACDTPGDCARGTTCAPNKTCRLDYGEKCTEDLQCASATCYLTCLASKSPLYGPCDANIDCEGRFRCAPGNVCKVWENLTCETDMECASGMCIVSVCNAKVANVKFPCDTTDDCATGLVCDAMKCKQTANGACTYSDECVTSLSCVSSVCK